jgi:hypothetical protein
MDGPGRCAHSYGSEGLRALAGISWQTVAQPDLSAGTGHEEARLPRRDGIVRLAHAGRAVPTGHPRTPPTPDPKAATARAHQGSPVRRKTPATPDRERLAPGQVTDTTPGPGPPRATGRGPATCSQPGTRSRCATTSRRSSLPAAGTVPGQDAQPPIRRPTPAALTSNSGEACCSGVSEAARTFCQTCHQVDGWDALRPHRAEVGGRIAEMPAALRCRGLCAG